MLDVIAAVVWFLLLDIFVLFRIFFLVLLGSFLSFKHSDFKEALFSLDGSHEIQNNWREHSILLKLI